LDDTMIRQFQFIEPETIRVQNEADDLINAIGNLPPQPATEKLVEIIASMQTLGQHVTERANAVREDLGKFDAASKTRAAAMKARDRAGLAEDKRKLA